MKTTTSEIQNIDIFSPALSQWEQHVAVGFEDLTNAVSQVHQCSNQAAVKAINRYATMRNWLIGFFIVEYQQKGNDRAAYGEMLLKRLERTLQTKGLNVTLFQNCRLFYTLYPQVVRLFHIEIQPMPSVKSEPVAIQPMPSVEFCTDAEDIIGKLSFSHICELVHISDGMVRLFYEKECIKCGWSVKELRRFIATNLHVRAGLSRTPETILATLPTGNNSSKLDLRQPYTFEFLGLKASEVLSESNIEDALLTHLQQFLLCTKAGKKMVEYAIAGIDNKLFVSTYLLQLPDKSVLEQFVRDNNENR